MKKEKNVLPPETIKGLIGLGEILRKIHNRLISEGYVIKNGTLIDPKGNVIYPRKEEPGKKEIKILPMIPMNKS